MITTTGVAVFGLATELHNVGFILQLRRKDSFLATVVASWTTTVFSAAMLKLKCTETQVCGILREFEVFTMCVSQKGLEWEIAAQCDLDSDALKAIT